MGSSHETRKNTMGSEEILREGIIEYMEHESSRIAMGGRRDQQAGRGGGEREEEWGRESQGGRGRGGVGRV